MSAPSTQLLWNGFSPISQERGCNFNYYNQVYYEEQRNSETKNFQDVTVSKRSVYILWRQIGIFKNRCRNVIADSIHFPFSSTSQVLLGLHPLALVRSDSVRTRRGWHYDPEWLAGQQRDQPQLEKLLGRWPAAQGKICKGVFYRIMLFLFSLFKCVVYLVLAYFY